MLVSSGSNKRLSKKILPLLLTSATSIEASFFLGTVKLVSSRDFEFSIDESFSDEKNWNLKADGDEAEAEDKMGVGEGFSLMEDGERRVRVQRVTIFSKVLLMAFSRVLDQGFAKQFLLGHFSLVKCVPFKKNEIYFPLSNYHKN